MRKMRAMALLVMATTLTACDNAERKDFKSERENRSYHAAMADYNAGRIKQALNGFKKVCRESPGNSSARFQLACLLQEEGKDMMGAVCAFREFLNQHPESDRAKVASERMVMCERQLAKILADKYSLSANAAAYARESETIRKELKIAEARNVKLQEDLAQAMRRVAALDQENAKLKDALKEDGEDVSVVKHDLKDAKALLDDEDGDDNAIAKRNLKEAKSHRAGETDATADRIATSADIAALKAEEKVEGALVAASQLPVQSSDAKARRDAARAAAESRRRAAELAAEQQSLKHPDFYVVQEGDTLYKIATRFYGNYSAWKKIREANKTVISIDGRVKVGDRLRLP